jgi:hypothetical protein
MLLVLPLPHISFKICFFILDLLGGYYLPWGNICSGGVASPGSCDLMVGRKTMAEYQIGEIVSVSLNHKP